MTARHLSDDRLVEICLDGAHAADRHLAGCAACEARRARIARLLTETSAVATAEADRAFGDERLARQRARILQRLEHEGRPGRLITFPASQAPVPALRSRPRTRWIAVAASAGLVIGLLAGQVSQQFRGGAWMPAAASLEPDAPALQAVSMTLSEEELLGQLELVTEGTTGSALRPLDDLTPRVWEVAAQ